MALVLRFTPVKKVSDNRHGCKRAVSKKTPAHAGVFLLNWERVGFEPTERSSRSAVFKTAAFNRSAISPCPRGEAFFHEGFGNSD
jgi:hypothetical protein